MKWRTGLSTAGRLGLAAAIAVLAGCSGDRLATGQIPVDPAEVRGLPLDGAGRYLDEMIKRHTVLTADGWSKSPVAFSAHLALGREITYCVPVSQWEYDKPVPVRLRDVGQIIFNAEYKTVTIAFGKCKAAIILVEIDRHQARQIATALTALKDADQPTSPADGHGGRSE